jgi:hypothetical protein
MQIIKCTITGKTYKDLTNKSGILSKHLNKLGILDKDIMKYFEIIMTSNKLI